MGIFSPKYPTPDTPGASATPAKRESRRERRDRERHEAIDAVMDAGWNDAIRASEERTTRFWEDYERHNGPGSVRH
ncbi:hypothetical protein ACWEG1_05985 [Streptomyces bauhiniae]